MTVNFLDYFLLAQISAFFMIFCRIGTALMMIPGFGEVYVSVRFRLLFALFFSLLLLPLVGDHMPPPPGPPLELLVLMTGEVLIGAFIGIVTRLMLSAMHVAGTLIAQQSSLAVASILDPVNGTQSPVISNLLTLMALTAFFSMNLHHVVLAALVQSYQVFPAGQFPSMQDMNVLHTRLMADSFTLGVMLAAPHLIFSLLFYLGGGLMNRLMPNFQVFFVMMPLQIFIAFVLLILALPTILDTAANFMQNQLVNFVSVEP